MTDIDPRADIEVHPADAGVTVRMPLAGPAMLDAARTLIADADAQCARHDDGRGQCPRLVGGPAGRCFRRGRLWDQGRERPGRETLADGLHPAPGDSRAAGASAPVQLRALVWFYTIVAFTFLYWLLDGGGPESRFLAPREFPELAFPAQLNPGVAPPGWRPEFLQ